MLERQERDEMSFKTVPAYGLENVSRPWSRKREPSPEDLSLGGRAESLRRLRQLEFSGQREEG